MEPKQIVLQHLDEAHALETSLVSNLTAHIAMTPEGTYRKLLEKHLGETREQVRNIDRRRAELGGDDGRGIVATGAGLVRDAVGQALVLTKGPLDLLRASNAEERMLKNAKDECATEALEIATYDALETAALAAGDQETAKLARRHRATEERTLEALRREIPKLTQKDMETRVDNKRELEKATTAKRSSSTARSSGTRKRSTASSSSPRRKTSGSKS